MSISLILTEAGSIFGRCWNGEAKLPRGEGIIPVIPIRRTQKDTLGVYTLTGVPTCMGLAPMEYTDTDEQGHRVYRCREEGCHLKESMQGGVRHCDTTYRLDPSKDIRRFGVIRRDGKRW